MDTAVRFIRKNGHVIPIGAAGAIRGTVAVKHAGRLAAGAALGYGINKVAKKSRGAAKVPFKTNQWLNYGGLAATIGSSVLGAATFTSGAKKAVAGFGVGLGIDAVGTAMNVASVAGHGHVKERSIQGAKQEARNMIVGNAVYFGGLFATKNNRQALAKGARAVLSYGRRLLHG